MQYEHAALVPATHMAEPNSQASSQARTLPAFQSCKRPTIRTVPNARMQVTVPRAPFCQAPVSSALRLYKFCTHDVAPLPTLKAARPVQSRMGAWSEGAR
jgi:hypothetical protein